MAAAKSMRRKYVGAVAKMMNSIPVERPQDLARKGSGTLSSIQDLVVAGNATLFTQQVNAADTIIVTEGKQKGQSAIVEKVESDGQLVLKAGGALDKLSGDASYKVCGRAACVHARALSACMCVCACTCMHACAHAQAWGSGEI